MRVMLVGGPLNVVRLELEEQVETLYLPMVPMKQIKFMYNPLEYGLAVYKKTAVGRSKRLYIFAGMVTPYDL